MFPSFEFKMDTKNLGEFRFVRKEEKKMTREQAIYKARISSINYPECFIQALEALGLLKFEEEKKDKPVKIQLSENECWGSGVYDIYYVIDELKKKGYTVSKDG